MRLYRSPFRRVRRMVWGSIALGFILFGVSQALNVTAHLLLRVFPLVLILVLAVVVLVLVAARYFDGLPDIPVPEKVKRVLVYIGFVAVGLLVLGYVLEAVSGFIFGLLPAFIVILIFIWLADFVSGRLR